MLKKEENIKVWTKAYSLKKKAGMRMRVERQRDWVRTWPLVCFLADNTLDGEDQRSLLSQTNMGEMADS